VELPGPSLWDIFADGARVATNDGTTIAHTLDLGYLTLPTGRIVASDPFLDPWNEPFSVGVPRGAYLVLLALVWGDVAAVMVYLGDGTPVSWRPADPPAFAVDSATGCLMDHKVCRFLHRRADEDKYGRYTQRFRQALDETNGLGANYCVDPESGANIILFHTWGGDGNFPSYFGYSAEGSLVCLVTDMYLSLESVVGVQASA
jgi:hypothetical protein